MKQTVLIENGLVVVDDVLDNEAAAAIGPLIRSITFKAVEADSRTSIWLRNGSLNPQVGTTTMWTEIDRYQEVIESLPGVQAYPTGTSIDDVLQMARRVAFENGLFKQEELGDDEYAGIVASVYRYTPGTRLVWHLDASYLGAFAMYLSGPWNEDWGGYFAFQDGTPTQKDLGLGQIIAPRSNRMIVFRSGIRHAVLSVANDAQEARLGISGFFVRRHHAEALLEKYVDNLQRSTN